MLVWLLRLRHDLSGVFFFPLFWLTGYEGEGASPFLSCSFSLFLLLLCMVCGAYYGGRMGPPFSMVVATVFRPPIPVVCSLFFD